MRCGGDGGTWPTAIEGVKELERERSGDGAIESEVCDSSMQSDRARAGAIGDCDRTDLAGRRGRRECDRARRRRGVENYSGEECMRNMEMGRMQTRKEKTRKKKENA